MIVESCIQFAIIFMWGGNEIESLLDESPMPYMISVLLHHNIMKQVHFLQIESMPIEQNPVSYKMYPLPYQCCECTRLSSQISSILIMITRESLRFVATDRSIGLVPKKKERFVSYCLVILYKCVCCHCVSFAYSSTAAYPLNNLRGPHRNYIIVPAPYLREEEAGSLANHFV